MYAMDLSSAALLFLAALAAGVLNSVAGGGGFIAFPALVVTGIPPINANATNTMALWPGTLASAGAYRHELRRLSRGVVLPLIATGLLGGIVGASVLLRTPQATFTRMVPWLLLAGTLLFAFSQPISAWLRSRALAETRPVRGVLAAAAVQFVISVYIGFFGAGAGILMLAMFAILGIQGIHAMNGLKTLLASVVNGVALTLFVLAKAIFWPQAVLMTVGASIGGYWGAYYAQRMDPVRVRQFVIAVGVAMTAYFFARG